MAVDGQYLAKLRDYYARHRVLPSCARIGSLIGLSSKGSVAEMVLRLKADGYLESSPDRRLKPGPRFFDRPVAESVRAGVLASAAGSRPETLNIDARLVSNPSRTVLVKMKGDSMIDAGIHEGDTVVVEKRFSANVGDIFVSITDNDFTLKRYGREQGRVVLRPENEAYSVIRPKVNAEIFGVVVGLFRTYR
jgi:SOS regulatory protein LexA